MGRGPRQTKELLFQNFKRGQVDKLHSVATIPASKTRLRLRESAQDDDGKLWLAPEIKEERKKQKSVAARISFWLGSHQLAHIRKSEGCR